MILYIFRFTFFRQLMQKESWWALTTTAGKKQSKVKLSSISSNRAINWVDREKKECSKNKNMLGHKDKRISWVILKWVKTNSNRVIVWTIAKQAYDRFKSNNE